MPSRKLSSEQPPPNDLAELLAGLKVKDEIRWRAANGYPSKGRIQGFVKDAILVRYQVTQKANQEKTIPIPYNRIIWDRVREMLAARKNFDLDSTPVQQSRIEHTF